MSSSTTRARWSLTGAPTTRAPRGLRQDIQAGIDPTAARERLQPQPVAVAGHHRITQPDPLRLVVAGLGNVGHRQQPGRGLLGPGQEPSEEPRVGRRAGHRHPTRGLQQRPPARRVGPRPPQICIGMGCFGHTQRLQTTPDSERAHRTQAHSKRTSSRKPVMISRTAAYLVGCSIRGTLASRRSWVGNGGLGLDARPGGLPEPAPVPCLPEGGRERSVDEPPAQALCGYAGNSHPSAARLLST
jgi:hypothetical protein